MSADRCFEPATEDERSRLTRAALDVETLNETPARPGWSGWYLRGHHPHCRLYESAYVVRMVRPWRKDRCLWFWGKAGKPGGKREESLTAAQIAAEAAAAIDAAGREA